MAVLVLAGLATAGCTGRELVEEPPESKSKTVTLTTTVGLGASTKALTDEGVKTFAAGETMALVYGNKSEHTVMTVSRPLDASDIDESGLNATFTFTVVDPEFAEPVSYIYPAAMAGSDGSINYSALDSQDGTLATLASSLDLSTFHSISWGGASLPTGTLENELAILAVTLKDSDGSNNITGTITKLTVSDGTNAYEVNRTAADGPIYVAVRPTSDATITVTATDGTTNYVKTLTGKTYVKSNGYDVSWRMYEVWESNEYKEGAWDVSKVVFTKKTATNPTVLTSSDSGVNLEGGWYTVTGDNVVINGDVKFGGETHLILCDGAKLTVNGRVSVVNIGYLYLYGQDAGTGKLIVSPEGNKSAIYCDKHLYIHGGDISATSSSDHALYLEHSFIMFGGTLAATSISERNAIYCYNNIDLYGGKIVASNDSPLYAAISLYSDSDPLTVYGGQLLAHNNRGAAIKGNIMSGLEGILFYFAETDGVWGDGYYISSPSPVVIDYAYIKAE